MSFRQEVVEELVNDLKASGEFKNVYKNVVPVWTQVSTFPAVAVLYEGEEKERGNVVNSCANITGKLYVYIYNQQESERDFEDILSDLIDLVYSIIEENEYIKCNTIDCTVSSMKRDGGLVHPYALCQIMIEVKYRQHLA